MLLSQAQFLLNPPLFRGKQTAAQSVANDSWQGLSIDTTTWDTYGWHNTSTRYTVELAGYYLVRARVVYSTNTAGVRAVGVAVNSSTPDPDQIATVVATGSGSGATFVEFCGQVKCQAGDFIAFPTFQNSGGSLSTIVTEPTGFGLPGAEVQWLGRA